MKTMLLSEVPFHLEIRISVGIGMQKLVLDSVIHNSLGNSHQFLLPNCSFVRDAKDQNDFMCKKIS